MRLLNVLLIASSVCAIPWDGPKATPVHDLKRNLGGGVEFSPAPTSEPRGFFDFLGMGKRQVNTTISTTSWSFATCGYVSGASSRPWTCHGSTAKCVSDTSAHIFGCCNSPGPGCQVTTSCLPAASIASCDSACAANPYILKCPSTSAYCNQYVLGSTAAAPTYWYCDSLPSIVEVEVVATDGLLSSAQVTEVTMTFPSTTSSSRSSSSSFTSGTTTGTSTSSSASASETGGGGGGSKPIGAIVGGTIGGLVVLGAFILGVIYLIRRKPRPANNHTPPAVVDNSGNYQPAPQTEYAGGQAWPASKEAYAGYQPHPGPAEMAANQTQVPQSPTPTYTTTSPYSPANATYPAQPPPNVHQLP